MTTTSQPDVDTSHREAPAGLDTPLEYVLDSDEVAELRAVAAKLADTGVSPDLPDFYDRDHPVEDLLPAGLRAFLLSYRRTERGAACLVHGFPVDDAALGPTPGHWREAIRSDIALEQELWLALCGMVLGDPFGWVTLQEGRIIQNILPVRGDEHRQSGYGSESLLEFHTEDGFHPGRCDHLLLFGLRNRDRVPTIVASVRDVHLSEEDRTVLAEERFLILPDSEHIRQLETDDPGHPALPRLYEMAERPVPTAVLFGDRLNPYLRIDRPFMRVASGDSEAAGALDRLMDELWRVQQDIAVGPGSLLVVDNYRAVHGRRGFTPRYDGTDRWLKKLTVSRSLRRNHSGYALQHPRVIV
ncbi:taurine catabolism dioxygenase tauD/tfdA [Streptomyces davaonensis JCM 4913]|uniref:Taurine catabolism dioxygenase tauD/tfdA n=1 Tax=Streptomyces davaonensis (strain DSM 101723 / JCM 4913 / KCC S-0913 / 768) TaxID=1214101 RepID=K4R2D2_STRDJ|nr:guanitoxin biosynthesis L-enduracididine beta-hydroxylase GntD [Streptomyces davaonensis]CCK30426.1 taurine catabolism dioxygenase tauD/tfdA [Streptomyces davaonensis JCM 4913]